MVRSPAEHQLNYDPVSLKIKSCLGWTAEALHKECEFLNSETASQQGSTGEYFWVFSAPANPAIKAGRSQAA